ncbi:hypothetical protein [Maribacter sp. 2308TA10-17]|uniref:hypothetical protein n=1 Tax=Maribacter sp. 2308TA10-17 TaxID=3386276 RepID=UPI0039BC9811
MKTQNRLLKLVILFLALSIVGVSCTKDEVIPPVEVIDTDKDGIVDSIDKCPNEAAPGSTDGCPIDTIGELDQTEGTISEDDFEAYQGELGVIIDARPLARKGHKPTQVTINVAANTGNYTETVPLDEFSFLGQLKLPVENLSDMAKDELIGGVQITPEYKDASGNTIFTQEPTTVSFQPNPSITSANTNGLAETEENTTLSFRDGTSYYIQRMNTDGTASSEAWRYLPEFGTNDLMTSNTSEFNGNEPDRSFTFTPISGEPNTFAIKHTESSRYLLVGDVRIIRPNGEITELGLHSGPKMSDLTTFAQVEASPVFNSFKFKFERQIDGSYIIQGGVNNTPIKQLPGYGLTISPDIRILPIQRVVEAEDRTWRIVSTDIEWSVTNIGTSFLDPILSKAETSLKYNTILTNCGSGDLSQSAGVTLSETVTNTIGWEESLSMSTSNTIGVSATLDVDFSVNILGSEYGVGLSTTTNYSHSWSSTETNSNWESENITNNQSLLVERTVTVPSGNASLVYDVIQFYPNTKVNFAQRMRVKGTDGGVPLTGEEIRSLFYISGFNGVVTAIEADAIVITLKGTMTLDKIVDSESNVQNVDPNCGG